MTSDFAAAFNEFAEVVEASRSEALDAFRIEVAKVFAEVVERTPVDLGTARAGWRVEAINYTATVNQDGTIKVSGNAKGATEYTMVNRVPYAEFLERGSSKQAPQGMLAIALKNAAKNIRAALAEVIKK